MVVPTTLSATTMPLHFHMQIPRTWGGTPSRDALPKTTGKESNKSMSKLKPLPPDVLAFLQTIILKFTHGERDEAFAEWAAVSASFLLEYRDQLY
jgi:hypothetical protein